MVGDREHGSAVLRGLGGKVFLILLERHRVKSLGKHHLLQEDDCAHGVVQRKLVLVQLREHRTDVQVRVSLDLGSLQPRLNRECPLQEVEGGAHFADAAIVASHVVEGHCLSQLVVFAKLLALLEQIKRTVNVFLLQVVDRKDVANLAQLLARACELAARRSEMHLLNLQELLEDSNRLHILAL